MKKLTRKQRAILNEIIRFRYKHGGKTPSYIEIGGRLGGLSHVTILQHLKAIEKKEWIKISKRDPRSIEIIKYPDQSPLNLEFSFTKLNPTVSVAQSFVNINTSTLFPKIIVEGSSLNLEDNEINMSPKFINFLSGYEPLIVTGCSKELYPAKLSKYFVTVSVNNIIRQGFTSYQSDSGNVFYTYIQNSDLHDSASTNYSIDISDRENQLSINWDKESSLILSKTIKTLGEIDPNSTNAIIIHNEVCYSFSPHIARRSGDLETCFLWAITQYPVLTSDKKVANNITRQGGKVYFYNRRKEQICLLE